MPRLNTRTPRHAFTLVELSIVLVILGLLVGGVLAGQSLIRAAELRAVTREYDSYLTAINTFRDKYMALPGDMANATDYWGIAAGTTGKDTTCYVQASTDQRTCNGNGDGILLYTSLQAEPWRFWQHLGNAGLVEGQFSGKPAPMPGLPGKDVPRSKIASASWLATSGSYDIWVNGYAFPDLPENSNKLFFGQAKDYMTAAILKPEEAYMIDRKIDDGSPAKGRVQSLTPAYGSTVHCATDEDATASYKLTYTSAACNLIFTTGF